MTRGKPAQQIAAIEDGYGIGLHKLHVSCLIKQQQGNGCGHDKNHIRDSNFFHNMKIKIIYIQLSFLTCCSRAWITSSPLEGLGA